MAALLRRAFKVFAWILALLLVLLVAGIFWLKRTARPSEVIGMQVPQALRDKETARLERLGLRVPPGGVVLERPFEPPWSARSLVVPPGWLQPGIRVLLTRDLKVRPADVLADVDVLEAVMSRAYGGWSSAEAQGWQWQPWFDAWRQKLREAGERPLSIPEAFQPMDALFAVRLDNHTQVPLQRMDTLSLSQSAVLARAPRGPCTRVRNREGTQHPLNPRDAGQQPRKALAPDAGFTRLEEVHYLAVPSARGHLTAVECAGEWIELTPAGGPEDTPVERLVLQELFASGGGPEVRRLSPEVVYARLPSMNPSTYSGLQEKRATWPQPNGQERVLVVDLRGNGGGSADLGWQVLQGWVDPARVMPLEKHGRSVGKSCLYPALRWNFMSVFMAGVQPPLEEQDRKELQDSLDALLEPAPEGCPRETTETPAQWTWKQHEVRRGVTGLRILALVDNRCGSDCEYLAKQLGSLPETVVVGRNTGGICQFIQPGYGVLPHTRLPFRIALGESNVYGDHRSVDGHGLDVDVLLTRDEDWEPERVARLANLLQ